MGYTAPSQIFDQKRDCSQHWLCFAISDGKKTASELTGTVKQFFKSLKKKPRARL